MSSRQPWAPILPFLVVLPDQNASRRDCARDVQALRHTGVQIVAQKQSTLCHRLIDIGVACAESRASSVPTARTGDAPLSAMDLCRTARRAQRPMGPPRAIRSSFHPFRQIGLRSQCRAPCFPPRLERRIVCMAQFAVLGFDLAIEHQIVRACCCHKPLAYLAKLGVQFFPCHFSLPEKTALHLASGEPDTS